MCIITTNNNIKKTHNTEKIVNYYTL